jgi:hypothetical protein
LVVLDDEKIDTGEIEPWDEPVNTRALLNELEAQFRRYIVVHDEAAATVITLWICFAWCHEIATFSPILVVQGADTEMAKTTACKVTSLLTPRARHYLGKTLAKGRSRVFAANALKERSDRPAGGPPPLP